MAVVVTGLLLEEADVSMDGAVGVVMSRIQSKWEQEFGGKVPFLFFVVPTVRNSEFNLTHLFVIERNDRRTDQQTKPPTDR